MWMNLLEASQTARENAPSRRLIFDLKPRIERGCQMSVAVCSNSSCDRRRACPGRSVWALLLFAALILLPAGSRGQTTTALLGDQNIESQADSNPAGQAEAFSVKASKSGTVSSLAVYLNSSSASTKLFVG